MVEGAKFISALPHPAQIQYKQLLGKNAELLKLVHIEYTNLAGEFVLVFDNTFWSSWYWYLKTFKCQV